MAEAVKQEQTEGETVSLDNMKDLKGKKGANLIVKILAMVLMPMLVIIFFAMLALKEVGNNTAETLVKEELVATEYAMQLNLDSASGEGFRYENGSLCKGEINFTENQSFFQNFTSNTNVDVVLFWDKEAAAASFDYSGIVLSDSVASKVLAGSEYFDTFFAIPATAAVRSSSAYSHPGQPRHNCFCSTDQKLLIRLLLCQLPETLCLHLLYHRALFS